MNKKFIFIAIAILVLSAGWYYFTPKRVAAGPRINNATYFEYKMNGQSMEPTLPDGSTTTIAQGKEVIALLTGGDVVLFKYPKNPDFKFIKRIIALPGENIEIKNNEVYVNGVLLNERYLNRGSTTNDEINITLKNDEYFLMGDNRQNSSDSRAFGPITKDLIVGQIWSVRRVLIR